MDIISHGRELVPEALHEVLAGDGREEVVQREEAVGVAVGLDCGAGGVQQVLKIGMIKFNEGRNIISYCYDQHSASAGVWS